MAVQKTSIQAIFRGLNEAGVRYLVAGGLAVVAHGYPRFTADVDLILDLAPENITRALSALASLGYRPRAPVAMQDFADPVLRSHWRTDKGMLVFTLHSPAHSRTEVDLFMDTPLDFESAYRSGLRLELLPGVHAVFVSFADLVDLKTRAGRRVDLDDLEALRRLRGEPKS